MSAAQAASISTSSKPGLLVPQAKLLLPEFFAEAERHFSLVWLDDFLGSGRATWPEVSAALIAVVVNYLDSPAVLDRLPNLRAVANHGVGVEHIDQAMFKARGIVVTNTPGVIAESTAEVALLLMLNVARRQSQVYHAIRAPPLGDADAETPPNWSAVPLGRDLCGSRVGIVGLGSIGRCVARRCGPGFCCRVLYHQRNRADPAVEAELGGLEFCQRLADLLPRCDFVVLACPLGPATRHMINAESLRLMRPSAYLINVARGGLVDTDALVDALESGVIAGAGLDVTEPEPLQPGHPLLTQGRRLNVWLTPHSGTHTKQARLRMQLMCLDQLRAALRGDVPEAALFEV